MLNAELRIKNIWRDKNKNASQMLLRRTVTTRNVIITIIIIIRRERKLCVGVLYPVNENKMFCRRCCFLFLVLRESWVRLLRRLRRLIYVLRLRFLYIQFFNSLNLYLFKFKRKIKIDMIWHGVMLLLEEGLKRKE